MTYVELQRMSEDPQILLKRLSAFAKARGSAKEFARAAGCDVRTAENMRRGVSWPNARHFLSLWLTFGDDFVEALLHPERAKLRLQKEVDDLARQLAEKKAALELADGEGRSFAPRRSKALARHEDRAAALSGREVAR